MIYKQLQKRSNFDLFFYLSISSALSNRTNLLIFWSMRQTLPEILGLCIQIARISLLVTCALLTKVSSSLLYSIAEPNDAWNSEMTGSTNFLADLYFSCTIFIIPLFRTKPDHWNKSNGNIVHFQSKKGKEH